MKLICNSDINLAEWKELLANNKFSSPFQTPDFYAIYNSVPGQSADVFALRGEKGLEALCVVTLQKETGMKGYFSRRGIIYGGPLVADGSTDALKQLLREIDKKLKRKVIYLETRNFFSYNDYKQNFESEGWKYRPYLNYEIDLKDKTTGELLSAMKYNRKREINQSINSEAEFRAANSEAEVKELYSILKNLYETRVKLPLPSLTYFMQLFNSAVGKIFIVEHNKKIIGGSFCYYLKGHSIYTMYYCGLRDYDKKIFPTHLAILAAINFGIDENLKSLDLMGAGMKGKEYAVRDFKMQFGGELVEHGRFLRINQPLLYNLGKAALKILGKSR